MFPLDITEARAEVVLEGNVEMLPLRLLTPDLLRRSTPVRTFRWHKGQAHFPGMYWSAKVRSFIGYESRLEMTRLMLADFDPHVSEIWSQPFRLISVDDDGRTRRHVPDFAIWGDSRDALHIVNVKPADRLADPKIAAALQWAHSVMGEAGFTTEVWSGADPVFLTNVRWVAGYRNPDLIDQGAVAAACEIVRNPTVWRDAERALAGIAATPRAILLHAVWRNLMKCDLEQPLSMETMLRCP